MNILLINNYDSFVYNLYHLIRFVVPESLIRVVYNDEITVEEASLYDRIIISPGPGIPIESGCILEVIRELSSSIPILGVCLGHQAIAEAFDAELLCLQNPLHGIKDEIQIINHCGIFKNMPHTISVGHYHSWIVSNKNLPLSFVVTAVDALGNIMALSHKEYNVHGIQFHPESIMTPLGKNILMNFLWHDYPSMN